MYFVVVSQNIFFATREIGFVNAPSFIEDSAIYSLYARFLLLGNNLALFWHWLNLTTSHIIACKESAGGPVNMKLFKLLSRPGIMAAGLAGAIILLSPNTAFATKRCHCDAACKAKCERLAPASGHTIPACIEWWNVEFARRCKSTATK